MSPVYITERYISVNVGVDWNDKCLALQRGSRFNSTFKNEKKCFIHVHSVIPTSMET